jgi:hypothetical protein
MKKFSLFWIIASMFGVTAFATETNTPVREAEEERTEARCESWKKERGNKYAKVPGSRLVCADKNEEK